MKYLYLISLLVLIGCGGSSNTLEPELVTPEPEPEPITTGLYDYSLTFDNGSGYSGRGARVDDVIYFHPRSIANGGYTVTAKITFLEDDLYRVEAFDYMTRNKKYDQEHVIDDNFSLTRIEDLGQQDLTDIQGDWGSRVYFDEALLTLIIDNSALEGSDTSGCNYSGTIEGGTTFTLTVDVMDCSIAGSYKGSLYTRDLDTDYPEIYGAMTVNEYSVPIYQRINW